MEKPLRFLTLDLDGVLHQATTPWAGATTIPDPPVPGAKEFLERAQEKFTVAVHSTRSHQFGGIDAMRAWCVKHFGDAIVMKMVFMSTKPPTHVMIDDRAICFRGEWPAIEDLVAFKPWNKP